MTTASNSGLMPDGASCRTAVTVSMLSSFVCQDPLRSPGAMLPHLVPNVSAVLCVERRLQHLDLTLPWRLTLRLVRQPPTAQPRDPSPASRRSELDEAVLSNRIFLSVTGSVTDTGQAARSKSAKLGQLISLRKRSKLQGHSAGLPLRSRYQLRQPLTQIVSFMASRSAALKPRVASSFGITEWHFPASTKSTSCNM